MANNTTAFDDSIISIPSETPSYSFISDSCLIIANMLFLLSYVQKELLLLRLILISAVMFLLFFVFKLPVLYLDVIIFDSLFIIINAFLSFKLISRLIPPKFTDEQKRIYNEYFCKILRPLEFKRLLKYHRRRVFRVNTNVTAKGNCFESIFFVVNVSSDEVKVDVKLNGNSVASLANYSWVGIVEYVELITNKASIRDALNNYDTGTWGVDFEITFKEDNLLDSISNEGAEDELLESKENMPKITLDTKNTLTSNLDDIDEVIVYEWDLEVLDKIFSVKEEGKNIMHGLHSMWLVYFSKLIAKQDNEIKKLGTILNKRTSMVLNDSDLSNIYNAINNPFNLKQNMTILEK